MENNSDTTVKQEVIVDSDQEIVKTSDLFKPGVIIVIDSSSDEEDDDCIILTVRGYRNLKSTDDDKKSPEESSSEEQSESSLAPRETVPNPSEKLRKSLKPGVTIVSDDREDDSENFEMTVDDDNISSQSSSEDESQPLLVPHKSVPSESEELNKLAKPDEADPLKLPALLELLEMVKNSIGSERIKKIDQSLVNFLKDPTKILSKDEAETENAEMKVILNLVKDFIGCKSVEELLTTFTEICIDGDKQIGNYENCLEIALTEPGEPSTSAAAVSRKRRLRNTRNTTSSSESFSDSELEQDSTKTKTTTLSESSETPAPAVDFSPYFNSLNDPRRTVEISPTPNDDVTPQLCHNNQMASFSDVGNSLYDPCQTIETPNDCSNPHLNRTPLANSSRNEYQKPTTSDGRLSIRDPIRTSTTPRITPIVTSTTISDQETSAPDGSSLTPDSTNQRYYHHGSNIFLKKKNGVIEKFTSVTMPSNMDELLEKLRKWDDAPACPEKFKCAECGLFTMNAYMTREHFLIHHLGKRYQCSVPMCKKLFKSGGRMRIRYHLLSQHHSGLPIEDLRTYIDKDFIYFNG